MSENKQAAGAYPVQEGSVRQPARTAPEKPSGAAGRGAERQGGRDHRRRAPAITKREAVATQLVNKSTRADLRATKMLIDMLKDAGKKAGVAPSPEPAPFTAADEEVMATFNRSAAAILGGGTATERHAHRRGADRRMTAAGKFTWTRYDTLLRLDFVSFAQRWFHV